MQMNRRNGTTNPVGTPKFFDTTPGRGEASTPFERFEDFAKKIAAVPKEEVDEKRAEYERKKKRREKEST